MSTSHRQATYEDRVEIATLHADSWRVTYRGVYPDDFLDGPVQADRIAVWEKRLGAAPDNQFVVLAEREDRIVGFACAYGRDDERWGTLLDNIHVRRERHRQRIDARLVSEVAKWCRANYGDCGLYLWVVARNDRARRFYEAMGATDRGGELRVPSAAGGEPREVRRYAWARPIDIRAIHA